MSFRQAAMAALERAGEDIDVALERLTVGQVFEKYAKARAAAGRNTCDSIVRFNKWIAPDFEHVPVVKLTKASLTDWRDTVAKSVKPATVNRTLTIFKACLKYGLEELEIPYSGLPIWKALRPLEVPNKARDRFLSPVELTRLANASDRDLRHLVLAATFTGARFGDLAALICGDWDRQIRKVRIGNSKTNRPRHVAVNDQARQFFDVLTDNGSRESDEPMLVRSTGDVWKKNTYRRQLQDASQRANISPPANFHMIRHSYASALKLAGVDDTIIAGALGHASTRMVQEHYGHLEQSHVDDQITANAPILDIEIGDSNVAQIN
jgi:integrase